MAIKLIGNYAKRLGLPGYSSHQYSVSIETELLDPGDIQGEAARIYALLQDAVDREIQETGFVPGDEYGLRDNGSSHAATNGNGNHNGQHRLNDRSPDHIIEILVVELFDRGAGFDQELADIEVSWKSSELERV